MRIVLDLQALQAINRYRGIGRYAHSLSKAFLKKAAHHDVHIILNSALPNSIEEIRDEFSTNVSTRNIHLFDVPYPLNERDPENRTRAKAAEKIREHFLYELKPDFVHIFSLFEGLVDNSVSSIGNFHSVIPTSVTLHDIIPYIKPEVYLADEKTRYWYFRKLESLKRASLLLANSAYSKQETIEHLGLNPDKVINVSGGVADQFRRILLEEAEIRQIQHCYGLTRPFIMCTSGCDPRKNREGLIKAFALLPHSLRSRYQLLIACHSPDSSELIKLAKQEGLSENEVIIAGYVSDQDLIALYNMCSLFVFPSLYEGFGLPILEAMSCGAAVIAADNSSLPELIGREDALFNGESPKNISEKMIEVLQNNHFLRSLREHSHEQVKKFSWDESATRMLSALEDFHGKEKNKSAVLVGTKSDALKKLAYISPLPPVESGIADYSVELLKELKIWYEIVLIVDQTMVSDPWLNSHFETKDVKWFRDHAHEFDRVLYQMGNSSFHKYQFQLLKDYPGVVALHDFFLSSIHHWMETTGFKTGGVLENLYHSHGSSALYFLKEKGMNETLLKFPCNKTIFEQAYGVIIHSEYSRELANEWYGSVFDKRIVKIPHLRAERDKISKQEARKLLNLPTDVFLICSFGFLLPTKMNMELLMAYKEFLLNYDKESLLIFVGHSFGGEYGNKVNEFMEKNLNGRVKITGYGSKDLYEGYLAAADMAVQLRCNSRGETSGTILDCLINKVPIVINAHGSSAEYPEHLFLKQLPDVFSISELVAALQKGYELRLILEQKTENGFQYLLENNNPQKCAKAYYEAIEDFYATSPVVHRNRLIEAVSNVAPINTSYDELKAMAVAISNNSNDRMPQLLVDISKLLEINGKTGIERVTYNILNNFIKNSPKGFQVEPIYFDEEQYRYVPYLLDELEKMKKKGRVADIASGDIYFGIELMSGEIAIKNVPIFNEWKNRGVKFYWMIHDVLPLMNSEKFPYFYFDRFSEWLIKVTKTAEGLICTTKSGMADLVIELDKNKDLIERNLPLNIGYSHLGTNIGDNTHPVESIEDKRILDAIQGKVTILMVGTVEPRKGYCQSLLALESLWKKGVDINLVIVGKLGWMVESLIKKISKHEQLNKRLFWLQNADDCMLEKLYQNVQVLLMASEGEGFGLPLIEAAKFGLPIIARNLPVFKEIVGENAFFFDGLSPESLSITIEQWLSLYEKRQIPSSKNIPLLTWEESTKQLKKIIFEENWHIEWSNKLS